MSGRSDRDGDASTQPAIATRAIEAVGLQRARLRTALNTAKFAENYATHIAAVNQSLAVMSRAGASQKQLRTIVDISMSALSQACTAGARACLLDRSQRHTRVNDQMN